MEEVVFRITEKQLGTVITELADADEDKAYVPLLCGRAHAAFSETTERTAWCVQSVLPVCSKRSPTLKDGDDNYLCVAAKSVDMLTDLLCTGIHPKLWITLEGNSLQAYLPDFRPVTVSCVVGSSLKFCFENQEPMQREIISGSFEERTAQAFGAGTAEYLSKLTVAVVGTSGTGSIVSEQLVRLGVRRIILIDDDIVETRNLGRIVNAKRVDAENGIHKTDMLKSAFDSSGLGTEVISVPSVVGCSKSIHLLSICDVLFGCLDSADGRHQLNRISTFYVLPYIDVGVKLVSNMGKFEEISGAVRYLIPGGSSLLSRKAYTLERLASDIMRREDPVQYQARLREKYIIGAQESSPAVISINMQVSSLALLEFLTRIHPFRETQNEEVETVSVDLLNPHFILDPPSECDAALAKYVGFGDRSPLLFTPVLGD
jgi:hypothetical protein